MTLETNLVGKINKRFWQTSFLNKGKVKFIQIKQDTIRQKCYQSHENE